MTLNREQMLIEMGIRPLWTLRDALPVPGEEASATAPAAEAAAVVADCPPAMVAPEKSAPLPAELAWDELGPAMKKTRTPGRCSINVSAPAATSLS